jgi:hypothetical protein
VRGHPPHLPASQIRGRSMIPQETLNSIAEEFGWLTAAEDAMHMTTRKQVAEAMHEILKIWAMDEPAGKSDTVATPALRTVYDPGPPRPPSAALLLTLLNHSRIGAS